MSRTVPPLPQFTFANGITIQFRPVGPMTQTDIAMAIQREMPKPKPPIVQTELGNEANAADPDYIAAVQDWESQIGIELNNRLLRFAIIEAEFDLDEQAQRDVARVRRSLRIARAPFRDDPDLPPEENDRLCYILHCACQSTPDLGAFGKAVLRASMPTEEAVQEHTDTFPGHVQGA